MALQSLCVDADGGTYIFHEGEFGAELILALPAAYAAFQRNALVETRGCGDMAPFYAWFSPRHVDVPDCVRKYDPYAFLEFGWPGGPHSVKPPRLWAPPPLRAQYAGQRFALPAAHAGAINASAPLVIVQNKYNTEARARAAGCAAKARALRRAMPAPRPRSGTASRSTSCRCARSARSLLRWQQMAAQSFTTARYSFETSRTCWSWAISRGYARSSRTCC
jgi:hypothetical protein